MYEQGGDHYFMESILGLLQFLQENSLNLDQFAQNGFSSPEQRQFQTAYAMIRFMEEMPGGFLIYYADGGEEIVYANRALLRIFQCDTLEQFRTLTGNSFRGLVYPEDLEAVEESIYTQIADSRNDLDYVEYRITRMDGAVRWIEDYGHYVRSELHRDIFYVFLGDATEKRERQLAEKENLLAEKRQNDQKIQRMIQERAMINQEYLRRLEVIKGLSVNYASIFYVDLDLDQVVPYRLSHRSEPIFGKKQEIQTLSWVISNYADTWVHPDDREVFRALTEPDYIREKLTENKTYYANFRVVEGDRIRYLQIRLVNVGSRVSVSQVVMGFRSVEEELRQEMEQKQLLAEALEDATRAISAKDTFLSNMSHDMRTPLNAICGFTILAQQSCQEPEEVKHYLDQIEIASKQLLEMIEKVLNLSQEESSRAQMNETECNLCRTVGEIYQFLLPQAQEKNIDFTLDCEGVAHALIYGDQEKLKQLVLYLANNALTYTGPGGKVSISVEERESKPDQYAVYRLVVQDTGIGISKEFLGRIFEPFSRERNSTLSGVHGIGLGLTIAKNIVNTMRGTIDVKSDPGKGSTFIITLRFRLPARSSAVSGASLNPLPQDQIKKILLVEDNEINREIATELLRELGFSVDAAMNGSNAVEKVSGSKPGQYDLILMDIQMPVMDGWQAAKAIRSLENSQLAHIPIIALSANIFENDVQRSEECGIDAHLPKPLDLPLLTETIKSIVKRRAQS